jgi:ABC-2 type transport system ATP-binding protein
LSVTFFDPEDIKIMQPVSSAHDAAKALEVDGLYVSFGCFALEPLRFTVSPGTIVGFLGENGAGKTTTLKLIMSMLRKNGGTARIGTLDHVREERAFKRRLGFVSEETYFYAKMSVGEIIELISRFHERWDGAYCDRLLGELGLERDMPAGKLSKGMRTKLSLVLALSHRPGILLLDEPTSGLDPRMRVEVLQALDHAAHQEGCGVLFSTHNVEEVDRIADRVLILRRGALTVDQPLARLRSDGGSSFSLEQYFLRAAS